MVLFDRSWYNRAGVERVMGFCTDEEYTEFMATVNGFELALVHSGLTLIKYWMHIRDETLEERFEPRIHDPQRRWKLSPMDLEARALGRLLKGARCYADAHQYRPCTLVYYGCKHQAPCSFKCDLASLELDPL